jgi:aminoglycoside 3-N-acetyltransferase
MHTKPSLLAQLESMGIHRKGTILVHSSMKSIGEVHGGADTVLDALSDYMKDGLLVLPTHTWSYINADNPRYEVETSPVCVGLLPELFRKYPGVVRSLHPTHSVAALGAEASSFTAEDERFDTPCHRDSAWGKLLDREAQILLVGVDFTRNTFIHGIEEWIGLPGRLTDSHEPLVTVLGDGREIPVPSRRHCGPSSSENYWKVEDLMRQAGAVSDGHFGNAPVLVCDTVKMNEILTRLLLIYPDLFTNNEPLPMVE